ncbi:enoyl-CoA hydratase (plasmid) [Paraburkholderia sp. PGU19]|uniref:enoyl-CoA hydratase/isomerase family protein n=1 Tax=Paraburkholderia sp. PGU19 TaxID=2735434 RepID=UPI0015DBB4F1|nr:enoyl-CoA hydratase/isomerase family protein [Paraburkholderia sp. PGU19]BCG05677.1 enoyl-CoA hydratase [Paraburkholderia sp. PGU19]
MSKVRCIEAVDRESLRIEGRTSSGSPVACRVINRVAIITLNRPSALNTLSPETVRELTLQIERCGVDRDIAAVVMIGTGDVFCVGGDLRTLYRAAMAGDKTWRQLIADEYRLIFAFRQLKKPLVVVMDGLATGAGIGLAQCASLRIVSEKSRIQVLGSRIGFVPDGGATWYLNKLPVELMLYIGLTSVTMTGADAISCGLADAYASSSSLRGFEKRLNLLDASDLRQSLREVFVSPSDVAPNTSLAGFLPLIREHFAAQFSVERCIESLSRGLNCESDPAKRIWFQATLDSLGAHSPLMLNVMREALLRGRQMTLADNYRMEFDLAMRAIEVGDFCEGVRAHVIDGDNSPRWIFPTLEDVNSAVLDKFFSPWTCCAPHPLAALAA